MRDRHQDIVSFDHEMLIAVDSQDDILGYRNKIDCHHGTGILHRAVSVFLFNSTGQILLQQRSADKILWPLFWANSCCSHPRQGETVEQAAHRRVAEELSVTASLQFIFKFLYHAQFNRDFAEHELCSVFVGHFYGKIRANVHEIIETTFIAPVALDHALQDPKAPYTPWLRMEWPRLRREFWPQIVRSLRL